MEKIKIFVVDDSKVARELLIHIINSDPELNVVGFSEDGEYALKWLENHDCDVITMDVHMPHLNGYQVTEKIMETRPIPTVIISSGYTKADNEMAFKSLEAGALAILEKPMGLGGVDYYQKAKEIIETIKVISKIKLVKRRHFLINRNENLEDKFTTENEIQAIGIGASLGGPLAIARILQEIPSSFPAPILIVQHIAPGFIEGFIEWLQEKSVLKIVAGRHMEQLKPGFIYFAKDGAQMRINQDNRIILDEKILPKIQPSVGFLFKSLAETYGQKAVGVILTGMGKDGAEELLLMKQKGAFTIAQDKESCLMFGMPNEAIKLGAVTKVLPIEQIANELIRIVGQKKVGI